MDLNKVKKKTHEGGHVKLGERITRRSRRLDSEALVKDDQQVMGNSPSGILPDLDILGLSSSSLQTRHSSGNANVKYLGDGKRQNALSKGLNEEREDINNSSEDKIIKVDVDKKLSRATIKVHHLQDNPEIKKPLHHTLVLSGFMNIYSSNIFDIHVIPPRVMDEEISSVDFMDNTGGLSKDSYSLKFNNSSQSPLKKQQRGNLLKKSVKKTARGPLIVTRVTTKGKENALNQNLLVKSKSNIKGTNGQVKEHHDNSGSMGQTKLEILVDNKLSGNSANDENTPEVSLTGDQHITSNFHVDEHTLSKFPVIAPTLSEFTLEPVFTIPNFGIIDAPLSHMDEHNQSNLGLTESSRQNMESKTVNNGDGVTDVSCVKYNNLQEQVKGNKLTEVSVRNVSLSGKRNNKTPSMRGNAVKRKMNEEVYKVQTRSNWKTSHQALSCSNTTQDANITLDTSCSPESNINAFEIHALKVYDVLPWQQCFDNMEVGTVIPASVHNPYTLTFQGTFDAGFFLKEAKGLSLFVFKEDCPSLKDKTPIALFIQMSNKDLFKIKGQKKSVNLFIGTKQLGSKTVENSNQNVSTRMFTLGSPASCSTPRHHLGEFGLITPPYSSNAAHNTPNSTSNVFSDSQVCAKPEVSSKHSSCDITPQKSVYLLNDTRLASARMAWHEYQATIAGSFPETLDPEFQPLVIMEKIIKEELEQSLNKDYDKNFDADFDDDDDDDDMNLGRHCRKRYERKGVQQAADTHHSQQEYRPSISTNHTNTKLFPQILCHRQTNVSENTRNLINRKEVEDKLKLFLSREKQFCEKNFDAKNTKANINNADFQNIFGRQGDDCVGEKRQTACGKDNAVSKTKLCSSQPFPKQQINKWSKGESKSAAAIVLKKGYSIRLWQNYDETAFRCIQQECKAATRCKKASKNVRKTPSRLQCEAFELHKEEKDVKPCIPFQQIVNECHEVISSQESQEWSASYNLLNDAPSNAALEVEKGSGPNLLEKYSWDDFFPMNTSCTLSPDDSFLSSNIQVFEGNDRLQGNKEISSLNPGNNNEKENAERSETSNDVSLKDVITPDRGLYHLRKSPGVCSLRNKVLGKVVGYKKRYITLQRKRSQSLNNFVVDQSRLKAGCMENSSCESIESISTQVPGCYSQLPPSPYYPHAFIDKPQQLYESLIEHSFSKQEVLNVEDIDVTVPHHIYDPKHQKYIDLDNPTDKNENIVITSDSKSTRFEDENISSAERESSSSFTNNLNSPLTKQGNEATILRTKSHLEAPNIEYPAFTCKILVHEGAAAAGTPLNMPCISLSTPDVSPLHEVSQSYISDWIMETNFELYAPEFEELWSTLEAVQM